MPGATGSAPGVTQGQHRLAGGRLTCTLCSGGSESHTLLGTDDLASPRILIIDGKELNSLWRTAGSGQ